jgi:Ala-tRNA(Pro) deacylase
MDPSLGNPAVCEAILAALKAAGVAHELIEHAPLTSTAHAAELRGTPLEIGGKALIMKADDTFHVVAASSASRLKSRLFRKSVGARRLRFATREELTELTGLVPGCVPPFGTPILPFTLHADRGLLARERIAFTPGLRTCSIVMASADWLAVARPRLGDFLDTPA